MDPEIDCVTSVENAHLRLLGGRVPFERFLLAKICDRNSGLPQWVIKSAVEFWGMVDGSRLSGCN